MYFPPHVLPGRSLRERFKREYFSVIDCTDNIYNKLMSIITLIILNVIDITHPFYSSLFIRLKIFFTPLPLPPPPALCPVISLHDLHGGMLDKQKRL